jgi:hypothetical protein
VRRGGNTASACGANASAAPDSPSGGQSCRTALVRGDRDDGAGASCAGGGPVSVLADCRADAARAHPARYLCRRAWRCRRADTGVALGFGPRRSSVAAPTASGPHDLEGRQCNRAAPGGGRTKAIVWTPAAGRSRVGVGRSRSRLVGPLAFTLSPRLQKKPGPFASGADGRGCADVRQAASTARCFPGVVAVAAVWPVGAAGWAGLIGTLG